MPFGLASPSLAAPFLPRFFPLPPCFCSRSRAASSSSSHPLTVAAAALTAGRSERAFLMARSIWVWGGECRLELVALVAELGCGCGWLLRSVGWRRLAQAACPAVSAGPPLRG
jgi:hypothetical protein